MKKIILLLLVFTLLLSSFTFEISANTNDVNVEIDGEAIVFDVNAQIINGRTMVPMRKIFEHLGSDVSWNQYNKSISAKCGYLNIYMQIDNPEIKINNKSIVLDVPPVIDNGRTLVPLRAVAEAFSSQVEWVKESKTVIITTKYPKSNYAAEPQFNSTHIRTSYGNYEYFDFTIDKTKLIIKGATSNSKIKNVAVTFDDEPLNGVTRVSTGKEFTISIDLNSKGISDKASLNIWTQKSGDEMYWSYINKSLFIVRNGNSYSFEKSLVLENNKELTSQWVNPVGYIKTDIDATLVNLSNEICSGAQTEYEKILKIHDWVSDNIYYNYDYFYNPYSPTSNSALDVYNNKHAVCEGYANLTQALLHAQNIPARKVVGYALGINSSVKHWTNESASTDETNHAWVQAYADNRWINIDTTWDSGNKYQNSTPAYKGIERHLYFDISDTFLSYSHKIAY